MANVEAVTHLEKARELLEALPDRAAHATQELQLLIALGPAMMATRSSTAPEIGAVYARARELAHNAGRIADFFPTIWGAWLVAFSGGDLASAGRLLDELFNLADRRSRRCTEAASSSCGMAHLNGNRLPRAGAIPHRGGSCAVPS